MTRRAALPLVAVAVLLSACGGTSTPSATPISPAPSGVTAACPVAEATGALPSSRLVDLDVATVGDVDRLTFSFGQQGTEPLEGTGHLRAVQPPFFGGASGLPIDVEGERFLEIRFDGVLIGDETGKTVYEGPTELKPGLPALTHFVVSEQFEGVTTFLVGFAGPGCVALTGDPAAATVIVDIGHG